MQEKGSTGRCFRCLKSASLCICADLVRVDNRTTVQIIQHPRERGHPLGTARMVTLALARSGLTTWGPRAGPVPLEKLAAQLPERTALLYPHPDARNITELDADEKPEALVVLDGTWHHAHSLHRSSSWLQSLPHLCIQPGRPSRYQSLRREPAAHCISTVEAVVAALEILEPDTAGFDQLISAFEGMIDRQTPHAAGRAQPRRRRTTKRESRAVPEALRDRSRLIVVYGECITEESATPTRRHPIYWSALRPATSEVFTSYIRCAPFVPTDRHLDHMGLDRGGIDAAPTRDEVLRAWTAFCHPGDHLVSWNQGSLNFELARSIENPRFREAKSTNEAGDARNNPGSGESENRICLKTAWCNLSRSSAGHLDEVVQQLGQPNTEQLAVAGRARLRLAQTILVLDHLRRRLQEEPG